MKKKEKTLVAITPRKSLRDSTWQGGGLTNKKTKVLVAMSGGVDSSVAAVLLLQQNYEVTGAFMVNYNSANITNRNKDSTNVNCWLLDYQDALRVAAKLGIPLVKLDFQKEYKKMVLDYMYKEYEAGRTPNPDVLCNRHIKFGAWLEAARKLGFDKLATGHYACVKETRNKKQTNHKYLISNIQYHLLISKDKNKDQTYFLNQLTQEQLQHVLFPLGNYLKSEVRSMARRFNLPTAEKEESMGICFVGEVNMKDFLKDKIKTKPGDIIFSDGGIIGKHEGLAFYTIGQRHIGKFPISNFQFPNKSKIQNSKPLYVVDKDVRNNRLIVGYENDPLLYKKEINVNNVNWISGQMPDFPLKCEVRMRHRQPLQKCLLKKSKKQKIKKTLIIEFDQPQRAVTPGQFAVFYASRGSEATLRDRNGECLGGGVIEN